MPSDCRTEVGMIWCGVLLADFGLTGLVLDILNSVLVDSLLVLELGLERIFFGINLV